MNKLKYNDIRLNPCKNLTGLEIEYAEIEENKLKQYLKKLRYEMEKEE